MNRSLLELSVSGYCGNFLRSSKLPIKADDREAFVLWSPWSLGLSLARKFNHICISITYKDNLTKSSSFPSHTAQVWWRQTNIVYSYILQLISSFGCDFCSGFLEDFRCYSRSAWLQGYGRQIGCGVTVTSIVATTSSSLGLALQSMSSTGSSVWSGQHCRGGVAVAAHAWLGWGPM